MYFLICLWRWNFTRGVRNEIYLEALARHNNYPDITIDLEKGSINIREYILNINNIKKFDGELEIGIELSI